MANDQVKAVVPTSAPRMKDLSPEERRARYEEIRRRMRQSRIQVTGDNSKIYYWARKDDTHELSRLEWMGYEVVHDDPKNPRVTATGLREDGTYVLGDVILMHIDKEIYEFLESENARRARELVEGAKSDFVTDAQKEGVPTFERDEDPRKIVLHK